MRTVIETETYLKSIEGIWTTDESDAFVDFIAENPDVGDVMPRTTGLRKVRWAVSGRGKRGGVRVIYFNMDAQGVIILLTIYAKAEQEDISPNAIRKVV